MKKLTTCKSTLALAIFSAVSSLVIPATVQAADVTVSSSFPWLNFDDTDDVGVNWRFRGYSDAFRLNDTKTSSAIANPVIEILQSANSTNSFKVDTSGDINLADGSVFIDRSANDVGIGTSTPEDTLHLKAGGGNIVLEGGTGTPYSKWQIGSLAGGGLWLKDQKNDKTPFRIDGNVPTDSIRMSIAGIGIGTSAPAAKLDVRGDIKSTFIGASTSGLQQLFVMSANNSTPGTKSDAGFVMENAREGFSWAFRTDELNQGFSASKQGTGSREFELINTTGVSTNVELRLANGGANVNGTWVNASSRSYKKNIHELSSKDAMQAMRGLKSVQYQFKRDNEHKLGFIAEDVPAIVATRDRKTLDPMQIVAVLTKAVQEQDKTLIQNREAAIVKDQKIALMQRKIDHLETVESRLTELEAMMHKLSSGFKSQPDSFAFVNYKNIK